MRSLAGCARISVLLIVMVAVMAATPLAVVSAASSNSNRPFVTIGRLTPGAPMNPFNNSGNVYGALDQMPLAFFQFGSGDEMAFWPGLSDRWQVADNGHQITVWLRSNARWSNGQPVTSQDVVTTMALDFADGVAQGFALGSVEAKGPQEIIFKQAPGSKFNLFAHTVLTQNIVPDSVYGHLLPSDIWSTIRASQYTGTDAVRWRRLSRHNLG